MWLHPRAHYWPTDGHAVKGATAGQPDAAARGGHADVLTFSGPLGAGMCCARAYVYVVSNQMHVRSCTEIVYMQANCRCIRTLLSCRNTHLMDNWLEYFQVWIFRQVLTFYDSVKPRQIASFLQTRKLIARECCVEGLYRVFIRVSVFSHLFKPNK